jgi:hypothetical protein
MITAITLWLLGKQMGDKANVIDATSFLIALAQDIALIHWLWR